MVASSVTRSLHHDAVFVRAHQKLGAVLAASVDGELNKTLFKCIMNPEFRVSIV